MNEYYKIVSPLYTSIKTSQEGFSKDSNNPFILFYDTEVEIKAFPGSLGICVSKMFDDAVIFQKTLQHRSMIIKVLSDCEEKKPQRMSKGSSLSALVYFYLNSQDHSRSVDNQYIWLNSIHLTNDKPFSFLELFGTKTWEIQ